MKILLVKTSSLGDIIHVFLTLAYLRKQYPMAFFDWVVEKPFTELVKAHPYVNRVVAINSKEWRKNLFSTKTWREIASFREELRESDYDIVFDLQGNSKSGLVSFLAKAKDKVGFGRKTVAEWPNMLATNRRYDPPKGLNVRTEYLSLVQQYFCDDAPFEDEGISLKINGEEQKQVGQILEVLEHPQSLRRKDHLRVMVCPGSAWKNKQLTTKALAGFLKKLEAYLNCSFLFVWGSLEEKQVALDLQAQHPISSKIVDRLPLPVLQNVMREMDLVIAMDSLPLHLAGTTGVPTFSVFGASSSEKYKPQGKQHHGMQGQCPYGKKFERRCPILRTCPTGACIKDLNEETIFNTFKNQYKI